MKKSARGTLREELESGAETDCNNETRPRICIVRAAWSSKDNVGTTELALLDAGGAVLGRECDPIVETTSSIELICAAVRAQATIPTDTEVSRFVCRASGSDVSDSESWGPDWVWTDGIADVVMRITMGSVAREKRTW